MTKILLYYDRNKFLFPQHLKKKIKKKIQKNKKK